VTRDGWTIVVSRRRDGWGLSAHRGSPDAWEGHPGRWPTEAEARAAAEAWLPTADPWRPSAPAPTAEPEPEPAEDATPQPAAALPGQLDLFGARR
jgi:hypothetical protein